METTKTTPIITETCAHNAQRDIFAALDILTTDPIQATQLLSRAVNNINHSARLARRTQLVTVTDHLHV
jgi:hypothetical protein